MVNTVNARITDIIQRTHNVKSFRFKPVLEASFQAGQFLNVTLKNDPKLKRYLSISSSPTETGHIEFTKKLTESDFSVALNGLRVGDEVLVQYPFGTFTWGQEEKAAFISGGIGITPIRSMCRYVVDKQLGKDIILLYANRTVEDIAFRQDFEQMQKAYPRLKVLHVLCEPTKEIDCKVGLIDEQVIRENIPDYAQRKFYLCGPPGMVEAMKKILISALAIDPGQVVTENFVGY